MFWSCSRCCSSAYLRCSGKKTLTLCTRIFILHAHRRHDKPTNAPGLCNTRLSANIRLCWDVSPGAIVSVCHALLVTHDRLVNTDSWLPALAGGGVLNTDNGRVDSWLAALAGWGVLNTDNGRVDSWLAALAGWGVLNTDNGRVVCHPQVRNIYSQFTAYVLYSCTCKSEVSTTLHLTFFFI